MPNTDRAPRRQHGPRPESALSKAVDNLRALLRQIGRAEFRAYGYAGQLRGYRHELQAGTIENAQGSNHAQ